MFKIQKRSLAIDSFAFDRTTDRTIDRETVAQRCTTYCNSLQHLVIEICQVEVVQRSYEGLHNRASSRTIMRLNLKSNVDFFRVY